MKVDHRVEQQAIDEIVTWRSERDQDAVDVALEDLRRVAIDGGNVMPPSIALAKAGGTTGEWGTVMRDVFGEYAVAAVLIALITAIAVLLDGESIVQRIRRTIPDAHQERADRIGGIVYRSVARYFAGSISVALLNGTVVFVVALILGVPLAPLAGIWAAVTNLIPQIGGFLGGSLFVVLATTEGALPGLIALVVFLAYQQLANNVSQPPVIGKAINLTPPTTMLAALIGGAAAGVPGALVATPLLGAAKSVWLDVHRTGDEDDAGRTARDSGDDVPASARQP
jgi:predicted PurR-regulated permease PerM